MIRIEIDCGIDVNSLPSPEEGRQGKTLAGIKPTRGRHGTKRVRIPSRGKGRQPLKEAIRVQVPVNARSTVLAWGVLDLATGETGWQTPSGDEGI
jgi:hypothetical protein